MPFGHRLRYTVENNFELYLLELQLYFRQKKKRIARCECCWQYFIPKTSAETHYCDRVIDGLSCKALGPKLKGKDGAALDEALRIYNVLRHRMEERRNRYEDAPPDQRDRLKPVSDTRYQEWIRAAVKVRGRYLKGKISASDFLREIDIFGELETYEVEQVSLPEPNSTAWRQNIRGNLDFDAAANYKGFISGRTMRNWRTMPDIRLRTRSSTSAERKPLNGSSRTPRKNTRCVIHNTEAWLR